MPSDQALSIQKAGTNFFPGGHPHEDYQTEPFGVWYCLTVCFPYTSETFVS